MEMWTEVRRRVLGGEISKRAACAEYGIHWDTLQKILTHSEPPGYRRSTKRSSILDPFLPVVHDILEHDRTVHRKQRHTSKRIFERLRDEHDFEGQLTIVKQAVRAWKQRHKEVFLPLSHPPGEAQVDFGFADVWIEGELMRVALFVMSLPYSDVFFIQAFPRECTESFLEGHKRAFAFFGGVPRRISYDNSKVAVAKIIGTRERQLTREFLRLQSHFLFEEHFCLVRRPQEKGHVEGLVEYGRRNFLVPVPRISELSALNDQLTEKCRRELQRHLRGKSDSKGNLLLDDQKHFRLLPEEDFEARRVTVAHADSLALVRFDRNSYSVPTKHAHRSITVITGVSVRPGCRELARK